MDEKALFTRFRTDESRTTAKLIGPWIYGPIGDEP